MNLYNATYVALVIMNRVQFWTFVWCMCAYPCALVNMAVLTNVTPTAYNANIITAIICISYQVVSSLLLFAVIEYERRKAARTDLSWMQQIIELLSESQPKRTNSSA